MILQKSSVVALDYKEKPDEVCVCVCVCLF